jgi:hypothetical protein
MKWLDAISKAIKRFTGNIRLNKLAKASLAISVILICRKIFMYKNASTVEAKIILENISSFYDKLKSNQIKNVSILSNSINYRDLD